MLGIRAREPAKGKYDIIGGFLENGEEPVAGGLRELKEETGIVCYPEDLKYFGIWIGGDYVFEGETIYTLNIIYTLELDNKPEMKAADDLESLEWVPMDANPDLAFKFYTPLLEKIREKYTKRV